MRRFTSKGWCAQREATLKQHGQTRQKRHAKLEKPCAPVCVHPARCQCWHVRDDAVQVIYHVAERVGPVGDLWIVIGESFDRGAIACEGYGHFSY